MRNLLSGDDQKRLVVPLIHLGGTNRVDLVEQWSQCLSALSEAANMLRISRPNMRDYYPLKNGTQQWETARTQHESRIQRIEEVRLELLYLIDCVQANKP